MSLADRLARIDGDDEQGALARREAGAAPSEDLVAAVLRIHGLGEWAVLHIVDELTHRGPQPASLIADALRREPLAPGARWLGDALVQLYRDEPEARAQAVDGLLAAARAALDAGGGTYDAGAFVALLGDIETLGGTVPEEAIPLARRLLEVAAGEADPYPFTVAAARRLLGETGAEP